MPLLLPSLLLILAAPAPPTLPPTAPLLRSAAVSDAGAPPPEPEPEPEAWVDLADTTTTGEPEFIDTDLPDGGLPEESPRLPLVPATPPQRVRRPQAPTTPPPPALARDLDPAITDTGCLGWSTSSQTAACVEGQFSTQAGGRAVLTLLGQTDEPYVLWTHRPGDQTGQPVPGDPLEVELGRARLVALGLVPLGPPVALDGPGREFLSEAAPAWLVWKKVRLGTRVDPSGRDAELERHTVMVTCGVRRARIFQTERLASPGTTQRVRTWVVEGGKALVADFTGTFSTPANQGGSTRAVVVDLERLCRRPP